MEDRQVANLVTELHTKLDSVCRKLDRVEATLLTGDSQQGLVPITARVTLLEKQSDLLALRHILEERLTEVEKKLEAFKIQDDKRLAQAKAFLLGLGLIGFAGGALQLAILNMIRDLAGRF